ncbi:MAG: phospholipase D-like domain-containing protein [Flavobacteriales bacterium]
MFDLKSFISILKPMSSSYKTQKWERKKWLEFTETERPINFEKNEVLDWFSEYLEEQPEEAQAESVLKTANFIHQFFEAEQNKVCFSPGEACRELIINQIKQAKEQIYICVFTLSDNQISDALLDVYESKSIDIKIITDDDKSYDRGSDIHYLIKKGVNIRFDDARHHMHHKFAIFDSKRVLTGSYNWTRSAAAYNQENIILNNSKGVTKAYKTEFKRLWNSFDN